MNRGKSKNKTGESAPKEYPDAAFLPDPPPPPLESPSPPIRSPLGCQFLDVALAIERDDYVAAFSLATRGLAALVIVKERMAEAHRC